MMRVWIHSRFRAVFFLPMVACLRRERNADATQLCCRWIGGSCFMDPVWATDVVPRSSTLLIPSLSLSGGGGGRRRIPRMGLLIKNHHHPPTHHPTHPTRIAKATP